MIPLKQGKVKSDAIRLSDRATMFAAGPSEQRIESLE
jgi:hypothetical protein